MTNPGVIKFARRWPQIGQVVTRCLRIRSARSFTRPRPADL